MNVLVIVAHPDDEVLGMGGTILKHHLKKDQVKVVFLATGISSRRSLNYKNISSYENINEQKTIEKQIQKLREDAKQACKILGVKKTSFYEFPDNEMDSVPLLKIIKTIENEIEKTKSERVYTHHYNDLNIDHRVTFNATLTACRPFNSLVKELITFEVPSSTEWNYPVHFNPNYFVTINSQLSKKMKAMKMYKNEVRDFPHPRSPEILKAIATKWGSVSGNIASEAFEIIRKIE